MSGTFELNSTLFPKDPLTKTWRRAPVAARGIGDSIYADLWRLELSFGPLKTAGEHDYFLSRFITGGLYEAVLPHPATGKLATFTGVSIADYTWTINEVDDHYWAVGGRLTLDNINPLSAWWNTAYGCRRSIGIQADSPLAAGYTVRFYVSGTVAAAIYNDCLASGDDLRVIYLDSTEVDRDLYTFSTNEVELFFPLQAIIDAGDYNADYRLYYCNSAATSPMADKDIVFTLYDGFETYSIGGLSLQGNWTGSSTGYYVQNTSVYAGSQAATFSGTAQFDILKAVGDADGYEFMVRMRRDGTGIGQVPGIAFYDGAAVRLFRVIFSASSNIFYAGDSSIDSGYDYVASTWHDLRLRLKPNNQADVFLDSVQIVSGAAASARPSGFINRIALYKVVGVATTPVYWDEVRIFLAVQVAPGVSAGNEENR